MKKKYFLFTSLALITIVFGANAQTDNTFSGTGAGSNNTGNFNTAFGKDALINNTSNSNSGFGISVLPNTIGGFNCAFGNEAMFSNTTGTLNSSYGIRSMLYNQTGVGNIAMGHRAMEGNTTGSYNTALGYAALLRANGSGNIAIGVNSPRSLVSGNNNIFIGPETGKNLLNGNYNVFIGVVTLEATPSSYKLAGNNTDASIVLADGMGRQRFFISSAGNAGLGLGNNVIPTNRLDVNGGVVIGKTYSPNAATTATTATIAPTSGLLVEGRVGIGNKVPNNKVEITHGVNGNSGLRFTNLTSQFLPTATQVSDKFLTVNANGDVVLQRMAAFANTTNLLSSNANLMTTNVNNIPASAPIVNSISNAINGSNQLITTVNGVASAPVTLPQSLLTEVDGSTTNELQTLTQVGNVITLSNGGGSVSIPNLEDFDQQSLTLAGNVLSISNGNSVTLPTYPPQTISQAGNVVTLSNGGGSFTLPTFTNIDAQSLSLSGNTLTISNGNSITLPSQTFQTISQSGNTVTLSNGGGSFTLPTTSVVAGTNVTVTGNGATATPYVISSTDTSLYQNNGIINQATTISGNRIVDMNNSNIWFNTANSTSNGKIYLGSNTAFPNTTGNYKMFVEGGIMTEKVKVALRSSANWADYVFASDYKLMPLKEVEKFVNANKHLPGIDSAEVIAKNGLDVAEMQSKQMEKIEELTLYIIDQDKKLEAQNKAIEKNNKEIEELKAQLQALIAKTK